MADFSISCYLVVFSSSSSSCWFDHFCQMRCSLVIHVSKQIRKQQTNNAKVLINTNAHVRRMPFFGRYYEANPTTRVNERFIRCVECVPFCWQTPKCKILKMISHRLQRITIRIIHKYADLYLFCFSTFPPFPSLPSTLFVSIF